MTAKVDSSGVLALSSVLSKVRASVVPSTAADERLGGVVSPGVAVASSEGALWVSSVDAMTRMLYFAPSVSPSMMWEVPVAGVCETSSLSVQSAPWRFH